MQVRVRKESMVKAFQSWKVEGMLPGNPPVQKELWSEPFSGCLERGKAERTMDC